MQLPDDAAGTSTPRDTPMHDDRSGHYFATSPTAASVPASVRLELPEGTFRLVTDRGVFSADRIDPGTRILLRDGPDPAPEGTLVDLGCGYGPIAVTLAMRSPNARVVAVDVNERALALCATNAASLGLGNVSVATPAEISDDLLVDELWSNPPIRIGKPALHQLLDEWLARLAPHGRAILVVQRHLGADSLQAWLVENGRPTQRLASRKGYRLLEVRPS